MTEAEQKAYLYGGIFSLANRLQLLGDKFDKNISVKQWFLIAVISKFEKAPTLTQIAGIIGTSRQNVKKMAVILEKQGFLTIEKDKNNATTLRVCITLKCIEYFKEREEREGEYIDTLFKGFDETLTLGFFSGMCQLEKNIIEMERKK